jgi:hypothetical protein
MSNLPENFKVKEMDIKIFWEFTTSN